MPGGRRYRALSLDLWFTLIYYAPEQDEEWREDRTRLIAETLRVPGGPPLERSAIRAAMETVRGEIAASGRVSDAVDPEFLLRRYAELLHATPTVPLAQLAQRFSDVGLSDHPPALNPQVLPLVRSLADRGIPVIAVTNTARRGGTWREFLRTRYGLDLRHVVASCDCGVAKPDPRIFLEAAGRLGVPASELLHVGDRWELDVEGALRAGCGAVLYRGLWGYYPPGLYRPEDHRVPRTPVVPSIERLEEVLEGNF